ncbi:MAG: hypothetical protein ACRDTD_26105, partial [Pseudonocardiaceae bacterium]
MTTPENPQQSAELVPKVYDAELVSDNDIPSGDRSSGPVSRRVAVQVPASRAVVLDAGSKLAILQHVAWRLSLAGRAELPRDDVLDMVRRAVDRMPNVEYSAQDVLEHLLDRSGVIREPVLGRVDFVHRT